MKSLGRKLRKFRAGRRRHPFSPLDYGLKDAAQHPHNPTLITGLTNRLQKWNLAFHLQPVSESRDVDIEGSLRIGVDWDGERICGVRVFASRPDVAQALVGGRRADEVQVLLPRIFSICKRAQAAAVEAALDAARGAPPAAARHREMEVLAEVAVEYLWRLRIDLPGLLGLPQRPAAVARLKHELERNRGTGEDWSRFLVALQAAIEEECGGEPFAQGDPEALREWQAACDAPFAQILRALHLAALGHGEKPPYLPCLSDAGLRQIGDALERDVNFAKLPLHQGAPAECGARARLIGHPLWQALPSGTSRAYQRVLARWIELAEIPPQLSRLLAGETPRCRILGVTLAPGHGIAGVETARGLLVHAAELVGERVARYRIVAPTEWNFHPEGALPADLIGLPARAPRELAQRVDLAIQSLDPCVRHGVELVQFHA